jgi:hypothetical protein
LELSTVLDKVFPRESIFLPKTLLDRPTRTFFCGKESIDRSPSLNSTDLTTHGPTKKLETRIPSSIGRS